MKLAYKIVEHDGGWAYQSNGTFSETYPSHKDACEAVRRVAREQAQPGEDVGIVFEDANGQWHEELSDGNDRPDVVVEG
jgi:hypothetical protein